MKTITIFAAIILAAAAAHATQPATQPNTAASAGSTSISGAAAGAVSSSQSGASASGTASAGGGAGGSVSNSSGGDENNVYVAPAPVMLPSMAAVTCPSAMIKNDAFSIGWSFISVGKGQTDTTDCTLLTLRNSKVDACQYASAKQIEDMMIVKYLPAFVPSANTMRDLSMEECRAAK